MAKKATGARAQSLPIKNIVVGLPHPAVWEAVANLTRIDHTRAAINPRRVVRPEAPAPRDESHAGGPVRGPFDEQPPAEPTAPGAGRKT